MIPANVISSCKGVLQYAPTAFMVLKAKDTREAVNAIHAELDEENDGI